MADKVNPYLLADTIAMIKGHMIGEKVIAEVWPIQKDEVTKEVEGA